MYVNDVQTILELKVEIWRVIYKLPQDLDWELWKILSEIYLK